MSRICISDKKSTVRGICYFEGDVGQGKLTLTWKKDGYRGNHKLWLLVCFLLRVLPQFLTTTVTTIREYISSKQKLQSSKQHKTVYRLMMIV
jgi:hypothetical protein